jgi:hypothetical protein
MSNDFEAIIQNAIPEWQPGTRKEGKRKVCRSVRNALEKAGYVVKEEDSLCFLRAGMRIWRRYSNDGLIVEETRRRRLIDLVVYDHSNNCTPLALVEVESDLAHMGSKTNKLRKGSYAVASIARDARGQPFNSYNSVERMAAAAQYWAMQQASIDHHYPTPDEGEKHLQAICSDSPAEHNPTSIRLFLVSHFAKREHAKSLEPRLDSLRMGLIVGTWDS